MGCAGPPGVDAGTGRVGRPLPEVALAISPDVALAISPSVALAISPEVSPVVDRGGKSEACELPDRLAPPAPGMTGGAMVDRGTPPALSAAGSAVLR
ncbi:hypothetical protein [Couchioplanes caeruleus]|uniref:Uncharacterized protein n=1 Tax=Couchioplanes caeruleus subsp. caeruleus TaxID=56427 RepID=A0A1K0GET1_9ACTN|nr:hypothetical protein [Couchioplanes caeruleus]OJF10662.1 hypothetical protein BG844_30845 [Couchioplanes caeruleus subsp. caeruleus]